MEDLMENIKNIFLTGAIKCGKSTLVNKILEKLNLSYSGYRTLPYFIKDLHQGFYIEGYIENENICKPISVKIEGYKMVPIRETFEIIGVDILKTSIESLNSKIILLDEIGFLEREAYDFKKEIVNCLDSNKFVIGVVRKMEDEFFDYIKDRKDTLIIDIENIDYEFRGEICNNIIDLFKEHERK
jgi:nucleoside-triphosphatase